MCSSAVNAEDDTRGVVGHAVRAKRGITARCRRGTHSVPYSSCVDSSSKRRSNPAARSFKSNSRFVGTNIRQAGNQCRLEFVVAAIEQCIRCLLVETGQQA